MTDTHLNDKAKAFYKKSPKVRQKIKDALGKIIARLKSFYTNDRLQSAEVRLVQKWDISALERAQDLWVKGVTTAADNIANTENTATEGGVKAQARGNIGYFNENAVSTAIWEALDHADKGDDNLIKVSSMPHYVKSLLGISGDFYVQRNHTYENTVDQEQAKADGRYSPKAHYHAYGVEKMERALLAIEHPIMTIATRTNDGNPTVIMLLDEFGNNGSPLYAVLSFYGQKPINGKLDIKPHVVLTIAEREWFAKGGRTGYDEIIQNAISENRVIDFDKNKRDDLSVIAQTTSLGNITTSSLEHSLSQFKKEINSFKERNNIHYQSRSGFDFDVDLFDDDDSVENLFAKEYATHHEDIGEVLRNISDIDIMPTPTHRKPPSVMLSGFSYLILIYSAIRSTIFSSSSFELSMHRS